MWSAYVRRSCRYLPAHGVQYIKDVARNRPTIFQKRVISWQDKCRAGCLVVNVELLESDVAALSLECLRCSPTQLPNASISDFSFGTCILTEFGQCQKCCDSLLCTTANVLMRMLDTLLHGACSFRQPITQTMPGTRPRIRDTSSPMPLFAPVTTATRC